MNFGTAYLDGSGIYGATPESADKLREFKRGFLKVIRVMGRLDLANKRQKQRRVQYNCDLLELIYLPGVG